MSEQIKVDFTELAEKAQQLLNKSGEIVSKQLDCRDNRTTIPANKKGQKSYKYAQTCFQKIGDALQQESKNLKSIGIEFKSVDEKQAKMIGK